MANLHGDHGRDGAMIVTLSRWRVVKCIAKLQEFKDRNVQSTSSQLTSDRRPVSSSKKEGTCAPFSLLTSVWTHPCGFLAVIGVPPFCTPVAVPSCVYFYPSESGLINQLPSFLYCGNSFSLHSLPLDPWLQVMGH